MNNNYVVNIEADVKKNLISGRREIYTDEGDTLEITFEGWFAFKDTTGECVPRLCEVRFRVNKEEYFKSVRERTSCAITPTDNVYWDITLMEEK